jgi:hypothetical protein
MTDIVRFFVSKKGNLYLLFTWDGNTLDAFKSGFFTDNVSVEAVPKEESLTGESYLIVKGTKKKNYILKIGDGLLRSLDWTAEQKTYKGVPLENYLYKVGYTIELGSKEKFEEMISLSIKARRTFVSLMRESRKHKDDRLSCKQQGEGG